MQALQDAEIFRCGGLPRSNLVGLPYSRKAWLLRTRIDTGPRECYGTMWSFFQRMAKANVARLASWLAVQLCDLP